MSKRTRLQLGLAAVLTLALAYIDEDCQTFWDPYQLQNVPAFFMYGGAFFLVIKAMDALVRMRRSNGAPTT